jgi:hypothetical protein
MRRECHGGVRGQNGIFALESPKSESRNPKEERKSEIQKRGHSAIVLFQNSGFGFPSGFWFRISGFQPATARALEGPKWTAYPTAGVEAV